MAMLVCNEGSYDACYGSINRVILEGRAYLGLSAREVYLRFRLTWRLCCPSWNNRRGRPRLLIAHPPASAALIMSPSSADS